MSKKQSGRMHARREAAGSMLLNRGPLAAWRLWQEAAACLLLQLEITKASVMWP